MRKLNQVRQRVLVIIEPGGRVCFEPLEIDTNGGAHCPSAGQSKYNTRAVGESETRTLTSSIAAVDWIGVCKIVRIGDFVCPEVASHKSNL